MSDQLISTFDSGRGGWRLEQSGTSSRLKWIEDGGDPGGYLRFRDTGGQEFSGTLVSPASLKGDHSSSYDGTISFDFFSNEEPLGISVVFKDSNGASMFAYGYPQGGWNENGWNHYSLHLTDEIFANDGNTSMELTLRDLDGVTLSPILGGSEGGFDNIFLSGGRSISPPAHTTTGDFAVQERADLASFPASIHSPLAITDLHCALV